MPDLAADEVVIEDHGGGAARRLAVTDVQASWEMNAPGSFSCYARIDDLRRAGLGWDLQDRWLTWNHPVLGGWGGVITGRPVENGVAEIEAEGWAGLLRGHLLVEYERIPEGGAGGIARRAVVAAGAVHPTYLRLGRIDEGGEPITVTFGGQDALDDVLMSLAGEGAIEWTIDAERRFHAMRRLGRDLSTRVRLVEDRHVIHYLIADEAWAAPPDEVWALETLEESARRRVTDIWGSMRDLDPRMTLVNTMPEGTRTRRTRHRRRRRRQRRERHQGHGRRHGRGGGASKANMPPAIPHWAVAQVGVGTNNPAIPGNRTTPLPTTPVELTVVNIDHVWTSCQIGNTLHLDLGSAGFAGRFRIFTMAIDSAEGELHLAGEALEDNY